MPRCGSSGPRCAFWVRSSAGALLGIDLPRELADAVTRFARERDATPFMVGLAAVVDGALRVEQWILTRLSAEAAMLAEVRDQCPAP